MKARVKATGDIVDATYWHTAGDGVKYYDIDKSGYTMMEDELDFDCEAYDNHNKDAYEVCRLLMLYIDRCWGDEAAANKVIACLEGLPTGHIFEDKDIERYRMR